MQTFIVIAAFVNKVRGAQVSATDQGESVREWSNCAVGARVVPPALFATPDGAQAARLTLAKCLAPTHAAGQAQKRPAPGASPAVSHVEPPPPPVVEPSRVGGEDQVGGPAAPSDADVSPPLVDPDSSPPMGGDSGADTGDGAKPKPARRKSGGVRNPRKKGPRSSGQ